ncbi:MAG: DUF4493 domain-containing protein [Paramuribaculum sp.]|nr:DUF4493 domain-containing protein [Paramuribaculum sp.]
MNFRGERLKILIGFIFPMLLLLSSCGEGDEKYRQGAGYIKPSITFQAQYISVGTAPDFSPDIDRYLPRVEYTLSTADGSLSRVWNAEEGFPADDSYLPGDYSLTVSIGNITAEGVDSPYMSGSVTFTVDDGSTVVPEITVKPCDVALRVALDRKLADYFSEYSLLIHSKGASYVSYFPSDSDPAFINPGDIALMLEMTLPTGKSAVVELATISGASAGSLYDVDVTVEGDSHGLPVIKTSYNAATQGEDVSVTITEAFFESVDEIVCQGFNNGEIYYVSEGVTPSRKLIMTIGNKNLAALNLSANWLDEQADLLSRPDFFTKAGIVVEKGAEITVDLTGAIPMLRQTYTDEKFALSLQAVFSDGSLSPPAVLQIALNPVDLEILSVEPVMTGIDLGEIVIRPTGDMMENITDNFSVELLNDAGQWIAADDVRILSEGDSMRITFDNIPRTENPVYARILYCGTVKTTVIIPRRWPSYSIAVDAYATKANIKILPEDERLMEYILSNAGFYVDGAPLTILSVDRVNGIITVTGLEPSRSYFLKSSVRRDPGAFDFTTSATIRTEKASALPNGDFEDVKQTLKYEHLPSGGRYSQNVVEIYNQQNHTDFNVSTPEGWATVNAKTFCMSASRPNTWYMQPSVMSVTGDAISEARAVKIVNTAWDNSGEEIRDYLQTSQPYTKYSLNIPEIKYRAVGKLFLGSYRFDPATLTETYSEGISFESRPSSLNGFYKFIPVSASMDQAGYVRVEILGNIDGNEQIIAKGEIFLSPATGFTAFSVPLSYENFGVKATRAKVMFAASPTIGDIEVETRSVVTVADPVTSSSLGNALWVDGVVFSY